MKKANFNVEGDRTVFTNANKLILGSVFSFVYGSYTVTGFTKWNILTVDQNGNAKKFYAFDFENWVNMKFIEIIK